MIIVADVTTGGDILQRTSGKIAIAGKRGYLVFLEEGQATTILDIIAGWGMKALSGDGAMGRIAAILMANK